MSEKVVLDYTANQINSAVGRMTNLINSQDSNNIVQLYDNTTPIYPKTKAEAVFFDGDESKTLSRGILSSPLCTLVISNPIILTFDINNKTITCSAGISYIHCTKGWIKYEREEESVNFLYTDVNLVYVSYSGKLSILHPTYLKEPIDGIILCSFYSEYNNLRFTFVSNAITLVNTNNKNYPTLIYKSSIDNLTTSIDNLTTIVDILPMKFLTRVYNLKLNIEFNRANKQLIITTTSYDASFMYSQFGYVQVPQLLNGTSQTIEIINNSMNYIYYDANDSTFKTTNDPKNLQNKCIILFDGFYNGYNFIIGFANICSDITTKNFNFEGHYTSFFNPSLETEFRNGISTLNSQVKKLNSSLEVNSVKIFKRVGVIGDSWSEGFIQQNPQGSVDRNNAYSWPYYLSQFTGTHYDNWGYSGSTVKTWMTGKPYPYTHLDKVKAEGNKCQAYIIALMINDQGNQSTHGEPVGTTDDIGTDNATFYGYYYKLIQEVVNVNPDAKIFLCTCHIFNTDFSYNEAVRNLVDYCSNTKNQNVYLLDTKDYMDYWNIDMMKQDANGHYSAMGYQYMSQVFAKMISDVINSNVFEFRNVNLIAYDTFE